MTLSKGDIVLAQFPFTDLSQTKLRPAVALWSSPTIDEVTICFISSQNVSNLTSDEFAINDTDAEFSGTGLRVSSKVRVTRITTLNRQLIVRRLGRLGTQQMQLLNATMIQAFQLT
jgi:mRNA interferase MazF